MPPTKLIQNVQIPVGKTVSQEYSLPGNFKKKNLLVQVLVPFADTQDTDLVLEVGFEWLDGSTWKHKCSAKYIGGAHNQVGDEWGIVLHGGERMKGRTIRGFLKTTKAITIDLEVDGYD